MKQTAVHWLIEQIVNRQNGKCDDRSLDTIIDQALAMEKEQHKDTWDDGVYGDFRTFEDYYTQTFTEPKND